MINVNDLQVFARAPRSFGHDTERQMTGTALSDDRTRPRAGRRTRAPICPQSPWVTRPRRMAPAAAVAQERRPTNQRRGRDPQSRALKAEVALRLLPYCSDASPVSCFGTCHKVTLMKA